MLQDWADAIPYGSSDSRNRQLPRWLKHYNQLRPHSAIGGLPPTSRLTRPVNNHPWMIRLGFGATSTLQRKAARDLLKGTKDGILLISHALAVSREVGTRSGLGRVQSASLAWYQVTSPVK